MKLLVLEARKQEVLFSVFNHDTLFKISYGYVENIGMPHGRITVFVRSPGKIEKHVEIIDLYDVSAAFLKIIRMLQEEFIEVIRDRSQIIAVGHRVTQGGEYFKGPTVVNRDVRRQIKTLTSLAPDHNKYNLSGIRVGQRLLSHALHIAFFDTSFQLTMPEHAFRYSLPDKFYTKYDIRKYGAHGLTHENLLFQTAEALGRERHNLNVISINFEKECSVAAIEKGQCIDSSAGLSPLSGLVGNGHMADTDPSVVECLVRSGGVKSRDIHEVTKQNSGFRSVAGVRSLEDLLDKSNRDTNGGRHAIRTLAYQIRKHIGAYFAVLGKVDAIVCTPGPENCEILRKRVFSTLDGLGIFLDHEKNELIDQDGTFIESYKSKVPILVMKSLEDVRMAETLKVAISDLQPV